jgi:hypothetical protein
MMCHPHSLLLLLLLLLLLVLLTALLTLALRTLGILPAPF